MCILHCRKCMLSGFGLTQFGFYFLPFFTRLFRVTLKTSAAGEAGKYFILHVRPLCISGEWKGGAKMPLKDATGVPAGEGQCVCECNMLRLAISAQWKCLVLRYECASGLSAGGMGGPDRQETGGLMLILGVCACSCWRVVPLLLKYLQRTFVEVWPLKCNDWPLLPQAASRWRILRVCPDVKIVFTVIFCFHS